jgi:prevent-host-death family protein
MMTAGRNKTLPTGEARDRFAELLNRVAYGKERVILSRRGKLLAAIVPIQDIEAMEAFEDEIDSALVRDRLAEWKREGAKGIALEEYVRKHCKSRRARR